MRSCNPRELRPNSVFFDIVGRGIANPLATILAVAMLLDHLGESESALRVDTAVALCLQEGQVLTPDLGGDASTVQVGDLVVHMMSHG